MRIGTLANAAGTTARAVRHYHRLGLLPEPARTASGYREYSMPDLVRLMRIRWLAECGVPLGAISAMPTKGSDAAGDVKDDLAELIAGIDKQQKLLAHRKSRLQSLLTDADEGRPLSALPRPLAARLDNLIAGSSGDQRAALERERDHIELLALSGALPDVAAVAMSNALNDSESVATYLSVLARWSSLEGIDPASVPDAIENLASTVMSILPFDAEMFDYVGIAGPEIDDLVPDPAQRAVLVRVVLLMSETSRS